MKLPQHSICKDFNKVSSYFRQLINDSRVSMGSSLSCDYLASLIITYLAANQDESATANGLSNKVLEYIRLNYKQDLSVIRIADVFNYNPEYISRIFRRETGTSVNTYVHLLRMEDAKNALLTTTKKVKEIAYECGYSNEKFFCTTFLKLEGVTPTTYRKLYSKIHINNQ